MGVNSASRRPTTPLPEREIDNGNVADMHALVFLWRPDTSHPPEHVPAHDFVVAADSGVLIAQRWGVSIDVAIGDFDSVAPPSGVCDVIHLPAAKDETDGEAAIAVAQARGAASITVIGSRHGRLDQAMGVLHGLVTPELATVEMKALIDDDVVTVVRHTSTFTGSIGDSLSLVPVHGDARGVRTEGLRYPLIDETLFAGHTRGISNELDATTATVSVKEGVLLAVQPAARV